MDWWWLAYQRGSKMAKEPASSNSSFSFQYIERVGCGCDYLCCILATVAIGKARAACAQSFALWQQAIIESTRRDNSIIACSRHVYILLSFAHIPFVVNHTFNATPRERLQHHAASSLFRQVHTNFQRMLHGVAWKMERRCQQNDWGFIRRQSDDVRHNAEVCHVVRDQLPKNQVEDQL